MSRGNSLSKTRCQHKDCGITLLATNLQVRLQMSNPSDEDTIGIELVPLIEGQNTPSAAPFLDFPPSPKPVTAADVTVSTSQALLALDVQQESRNFSADNLEGSVFANKYEVMDLLGRGGMSVVYRAKHQAMGKICALKVLHMHLASDDLSIRRFKQEAQASSILSHPGIVSVTDCGEGASGMPYLVMDYVDGLSLSDLLKQDGPLTLDRFLSLMQQVASALAHAHTKSIVHRDLKPSNIMVCTEENKEQARIVDFGIAKILSQSNEGQQALTQTGEVFGSPLYMSPEQCSGSAIDQRTDIYALGCVMYEALSGNLPHRGNTVIETMHKHVNEPPPPLVAKQIPEDARQKIETILLRCLAKLPEDRYQNATEIESELRALSMRTGTGVFAKLAGAWDLASAKSRAKRKSKLPLLLASLATTMLSVILLLLGLNKARLELIEVEKSREVFNEVAFTQGEFLRLGEDTRQYFTSMMFHKDDTPERKRKFEKSEQVVAARLKTIEKTLDALELDLPGGRENREQMIRTLQAIPRQGNIGVDSLRRAGEFGTALWNTENIAVIGNMANVMERGVKVLHQMLWQAKKVERKRYRQFSQTEQEIFYLSIICAVLNAGVMLSLGYYFVRGNPERMRKLVEQANKLAKRQGLAKTGDVNQDAVAELDSVLQELATALSQAEERERALLLKLKEQEKTDKLHKTN